MLLQTNSYIVPKERRAEHARLLRRFRQVLMRLGCDLFEVYEQMGPNWTSGDGSGRFVQIMRFRDRKHQREVHAAEQSDPAAQQLIGEFCDLVNLPYQQQQGLLAIGYYQGVIDVPASVINKQSAPTPTPVPVTRKRVENQPQTSFGFGVPPPAASALPASAIGFGGGLAAASAFAESADTTEELPRDSAENEVAEEQTEDAAEETEATDDTAEVEEATSEEHDESELTDEPLGEAEFEGSELSDLEIPEEAVDHIESPEAAEDSEQVDELALESGELEEIESPVSEEAVEEELALPEDAEDEPAPEADLSLETDDETEAALSGLDFTDLESAEAPAAQTESSEADPGGLDFSDLEPAESPAVESLSPEAWSPSVKGDAQAEATEGIDTEEPTASSEPLASEPLASKPANEFLAEPAEAQTFEVPELSTESTIPEPATAADFLPEEHIANEAVEQASPAGESLQEAADSGDADRIFGLEHEAGESSDSSEMPAEASADRTDFSGDLAFAIPAASVPAATVSNGQHVDEAETESDEAEPAAELPMHLITDEGEIEILYEEFPEAFEDTTEESAGGQDEIEAALNEALRD